MGGSHSSYVEGPTIHKYVLPDELMKVCEQIDVNARETMYKKSQLKSKGISTKNISGPMVSVSVQSNPEKLEKALKQRYGECLRTRFEIKESVDEVFSGDGGRDTVHEIRRWQVVNLDYKC